MRASHYSNFGFKPVFQGAVTRPVFSLAGNKRPGHLASNIPTAGAPRTAEQGFSSVAPPLDASD